jgi:hypothetical protein
VNANAWATTIMTIVATIAAIAAIPPSKHRKHLFMGCGTLLIVAVILFVLPSAPRDSLSGGNPDGTDPNKAVASHDKADTTPSSRIPLPIKIDRVRFPVPRCSTFAGEGDVSVGQNLWLAVLSDTKRYYFKPVIVNPAEHSWISKNVTIGAQGDSPGTVFTVYAVVVDDATNQRLQQERYAGGITDLPANFAVVDQMRVSRSTDSKACT